MLSARQQAPLAWPVPLALAALLAIALMGVAPSDAAHRLAADGLSFPDILPAYGESLELVGRLDLLASEAPFPSDAENREYTWTLNGPVVHEFREPAPGIRYRELTFGILEIREDPDRDSAFLESPPNMSVPSSFHDGEILLMATVTNLVLREVFGIVTAHADLYFSGGTRIGVMESREWTFNAAISTNGEEIPTGYGSRWRLDLVPHRIVSVDSRSWGGIKSLYR